MEKGASPCIRCRFTPVMRIFIMKNLKTYNLTQ
jgi:hypothetical protein